MLQLDEKKCIQIPPYQEEDKAPPSIEELNENLSAISSEKKEKKEKKKSLKQVKPTDIESSGKKGVKGNNARKKNSNNNEDLKSQTNTSIASNRKLLTDRSQRDLSIPQRKKGAKDKNSARDAASSNQQKDTQNSVNSVSDHINDSFDFYNRDDFEINDKENKDPTNQEN